jgi:hypothetical protein
MSLILKLNFLGKSFKIDSLCALCAFVVKFMNNAGMITESPITVEPT